MIKQVLIVLLITLITPAAYTQVLGELQWEEVPTIIVPDVDFEYQNQGLLIVESPIPGLKFKSTNPLRKGWIYQKDDEPGIWYVKVSAGTNIIDISTNGFLPLLNIRHNFKVREAWKIRVTPKQILGALTGFDENRAEIRLNYQPSSPDEAVYGGLDDMIMKIDFARGYAVFNPSPGAHKIKLNAGGRIWEKSFDLKSKEKIEEQISFSGGKQEQLDIKDPGNLFVESEPNGAIVYLNKVEQGITPLPIEGLQPGTYQVEVVRELYLPESKVIKVESNSYAKENIKLTPNFGRISINSNPQGAMLWINDKNVGRTPYIGQFDAGEYSLRMIFEMYYEEIDTFEIQPGGKFIQTYDLKPQFGGIYIDSDPPGAKLSIDGQSAGTTPVTNNQLVSGRHIIRLTKEHFFDYETSIEIKDGQPFSETYILKANSGLLSVISTPSGASVLIAGTNRELGETPLQDYRLAPGTYNIRVEKDSYESNELLVSMMIGGELKLEPKLKRKTGKLHVKSEPPMAEIYLNGERKGHTPTILNDLPTGEYQIRLQKIGFDTQLNKIRVEHNRQAEYSIRLGTEGTVEWKKRRSRARSLSFLPGAANFSSKQYVKGSIYAGAFIGSLAMMYLASEQYSNVESDFERALWDYKSAEDQVSINQSRSNAQSAFDDMHLASKKVKVFMIATAGVYAWQFIDTWFWGGGKRPISGQLHSSVNQDKLMVGMSFAISTSSVKESRLK